jgi:hypothetical protein
MSFTEYITKPGDRWDLIAYKAYGTIDDIRLDDGSTINSMSYVIQSNPDLPIDDILQEGLLLKIPVIPSATIQTDLEILPPWKR